MGKEKSRGQILSAELWQESCGEAEVRPGEYEDVAYSFGLFPRCDRNAACPREARKLLASPSQARCNVYCAHCAVRRLGCQAIVRAPKMFHFHVYCRCVCSNGASSSHPSFVSSDFCKYLPIPTRFQFKEIETSKWNKEQ